MPKIALRCLHLLRRVNYFYKLYSIDFLGLSLILLIGLGVRLYRLSEQSIWHEEYVLVANVGACDLITNIKLLLVNVPEYGISPGGLVFYYFWIRLVGNTIWMWRLLPIIFSLFAIALVYFWGKDLGGRKVGFLSALFISISPFNVYISQELKNYSFVLFFSLLSWYSFNKCFIKGELKRDVKWLTINILSNFILPWFHAIYIHLFFFQTGFFVLRSLWDKGRNLVSANRLQITDFYQVKDTLLYLIIWFLGNMLGIFIFLLWLLSVKNDFYNLSLTRSEFSANVLSIFRFLVISLFGNDCVSFSNELLPAWRTNETYLARYWIFLKDLLWYLNFLLIGFFTIFSFSIFIRRDESFKVLNKFYSFQDLSYLGYIFFFIPFSLFLISLFFDIPIFLPLYFYYASVVLYLIISLQLLRVKSIYFSSLLGGTIVLIVTLNTLMLVNFSSRPDYKNAVEYLETNVGVGETVFDLQLGANVFETWKIYKKRGDYYIKPVFSIQAIMDESIKIFEGNLKVNNAWVLMETSLLHWIFGKDPVNIAMSAFARIGTVPEIICFPGSFNLYVLKIPRIDNGKLDENTLDVEPFLPIDYASLWRDLGQSKSIENNPFKVPLKKLKYYFSIWPPLYSYNSILILSDMIDKGDDEIAKVFCNFLLKQYPHSFHFLMLSYLIEEREKESDRLFSNYVFRSLYLPVYRGIINGKRDENFYERLHLFEVLERKGFHILNKAILKKATD